MLKKSRSQAAVSMNLPSPCASHFLMYCCLVLPIFPAMPHTLPPQNFTPPRRLVWFCSTGVLLVRLCCCDRSWSVYVSHNAPFLHACRARDCPALKTIQLAYVFALCLNNTGRKRETIERASLPFVAQPSRS